MHMVRGLQNSNSFRGALVMWRVCQWLSDVTVSPIYCSPLRKMALTFAVVFQGEGRPSSVYYKQPMYSSSNKNRAEVQFRLAL